MARSSDSVTRAKEINNIKSADTVDTPVKNLSNLPKATLDSITKEITLPSLGIPYSGAVPGGKLTIRMMKVSDTKLLFSNAIPQHDRINQLIARVVIDMPIKIEEMLLQDKFYILVQSRILSLSNSYKYKIQCPSCSAVNNLQIDLDKLECINLTEAKLNQSVKLPISGRDVVLRQMTVADEMAGIKFLTSEKTRAEREGRRVGEEELIPFTLSRQIESISGLEDDLSTKLEFVNNMVSLDYESLQKALRAMDFGIVIELYNDCTKCGYGISYNLPFDIEWFRPRL